jgi:acyl phosphate:glycerol-3-phosphate acyltransferase
MNLAMIIFWTIATYLIASMPFSLLLGCVVLGKDIRKFGDGNPGATNVKRAGGGIGWYIVALLLDGFKGLFPVGILYWIYGWFGYEIVPVAIAAILGHSFPIFLRFKGGKAVAITGGVWVGLLILEAILIIPMMLTFWYTFIREDEWAVVLMLLCLLLYLILTRPDNYPLLLVWLGNAAIVAFNHRRGFTKLPTLRHKGAAS